jgi:hypothetical protein
VTKTSLEDLVPNVIQTTYTTEILSVRFVDYLAGRASGIYPNPIDPPRLLKRTRPQFGKTPYDHLFNATDVMVADNRIKDIRWYTNMDKNLSKMNPILLEQLSNQSNDEMPSRLDEFFRNLQNFLQLKTIMNRYSNHQIPFFLPPMNISNPSCSTVIFPYANSSRVRFDHFFDSIIKINMLRAILRRSY